MNNLLLYILFFLFSLKINAGAPAPSTSLPEPPYVFEKGTLITAEVDWNKESIKKFISNDINLDETVNGSIDYAGDDGVKSQQSSSYTPQQQAPQPVARPLEEIPEGEAPF